MKVDFRLGFLCHLASFCQCTIASVWELSNLPWQDSGSHVVRTILVMEAVNFGGYALKNQDLTCLSWHLVKIILDPSSRPSPDRILNFHPITELCWIFHRGLTLCSQIIIMKQKSYNCQQESLNMSFLNFMMEIFKILSGEGLEEGSRMVFTKYHDKHTCAPLT